MPSLDELQTALVNAHQAGDVGAATTLANEIVKVQGTQPSLFDQFRKGVKAANISPYELGGKIADAGYPGLGFATNVAAESIPAMIGGGASKIVVEPAKNLARWLMQSAVKPTLAQLESGKAERAIEIMLQKGYNPTEGGVLAMREKAGELSQKVGDVISGSTEKLNKYHIEDALRDTTSKFLKQANPKSDVAAIENVGNEFLSHPLLTGKNEIPVQLAQELKQGTQKILEKKFGTVGTAEESAQKDLARALRLGIEGKHPEVVALNKEASDLYNAAKVANRRALMEGNKNIAGLTPMAHSEGGMLAFLADKFGLTKSVLARMLYTGTEPVVTNATRLGVGGVEGLRRD